MLQHSAHSTHATVPAAGVAEWRALGEQATQTLRGPPYQVRPPHQHNQAGPQQYYGRSQHISAPFPVQNFRYSPNSNAEMSLSYESRTFMPDANYPDSMQIPHHPQDQEDFKHEQPRYPSPPPPLSENPYNPQAIGAPPDDRLEIPELPKDDSEAASPGRSKPVPKPDREVTRDANGRFYCNWPNCTEEVREFNRKCEWRLVVFLPRDDEHRQLADKLCSKHMDKHDRPYKCPAEGCEKLPGFTYSGGLLRHEREVHNKHGGPRKQLNCPHPNCKRHTGKGFSRQENLNEHLRRVHTTDTGLMPNGDDTEEDGSDSKAGQKRKRMGGRSDSADLREEMKRLRQENEELRRQSEAQTAQTAEMMRQIQQLQASLHPRMQAPQAPMM